MYQCGGRNVTQSFCTNSSMYDFSNLPIGGTKTCQKKGLFLFVSRMDSYNGNVRIPIVRTRISFRTWQCFFHLNISRHMWIVVESPKTFLIAIVLMVLTSLVRDLQAAEVWQKLPSQVLEVTKNLVAWGVMYETCWLNKWRFQVINLLICSLVQCFFLLFLSVNRYWIYILWDFLAKQWY